MKNYRIDKFCCKDLKNIYGKELFVNVKNQPYLLNGTSFPEYMIKCCPFCGEKIKTIPTSRFAPKDERSKRAYVKGELLTGRGGGPLLIETDNDGSIYVYEAIKND